MAADNHSCNYGIIIRNCKDNSSHRRRTLTLNIACVLGFVGIWACGFLMFTLLAKASIAIELGEVRARGADGRAQAST
ncbi:MAG: hypothetical protein KGI67_08500 [Pseudomonadota bacterium]|nr:hypothetical protein [Pseudomonadota bacterium]